MAISKMLDTMEDYAEAADSIIDELRKAIHDMMAHAGSAHPDIGWLAAALEQLASEHQNACGRTH